jgi:transportin-3
VVRGFIFAFRRFLKDLSNVDNLANLEVMLHTVGTFGETLPETCRNTCEEAWSVLDAFIIKYGSDADSAEHVTRLIRQGISLFGDAALSVAPAVLSRMASAFETTNLSGYLWIIGKIVQTFGNDENPALRSAIRDAYESTTKQVAVMLTSKRPELMPDGK